ncbi:hypothetical protein [Desulfobotulus mexicanus]|uniref:Uncharacterized protein n=1 Tax=Desulfobotulus mexicanus TaxID=2586642 RepID=A0A5Q4VGR7_9BACT|nr:hypothetical protein [Desulfobotulus mexicanus]TYT75161.1 hypothetical protein FIM25_05450 [Desulfobotulus mexicanus]
MEAILVFIGFLVGQFLPSYLREKGKNLATKEDVERITRNVEAVKAEYSEKLQELIHQNNLLLEQAKGRQQLRFAAVEKRLQVHQEAYLLWRQMISKVHSEENADVVMACQDWYNVNCLYLDQASRAAFRSAYSALAIHPTLLAARENDESIKRNFMDVTSAGEAIVKGAELPSLGENEYELIARDQSSNNLRKGTPESGAPS